jgi:hypothetical protein
MNAKNAISQLREGKKPEWPVNSDTYEFAQSLDNSDQILKSFRSDFIVPTKAQLKRKTLTDNEQTSKESSRPEDESIYFCGNSLGKDALLRTACEICTNFVLPHSRSATQSDRRVSQRVLENMGINCSRWPLHSTRGFTFNTVPRHGSRLRTENV